MSIMRKFATTFISLLALILLAGIGDCDTLAPSDSSAPAVHFSNSGILGTKINETTFVPGEVPLTNHGYFYSCSNIRYSLRDLAVIKTRLRILNEEFSCSDEFRPQFEPEIELCYKTKRSTVALRGGYIDHFTLGHGLTIKEFSQSGAIGTITYDKWRVSGGIFTLGYGFDEDLNLLTAEHEGFPIKLSALAIIKRGVNPDYQFNGNQYYMTGYLLPGYEYTFKKLTVYAEYGYKINKSRNVDKFIIEDSPSNAQAGLVGIKTDFQKKHMDFKGCMELRASQKGFIPVTGVNIDRFAKFWNENDSRANWVDFFDSRKDFFWWYMNIDLNVRLSVHWRIFFRDEVLYFYSRQKELTIFSPEEDPHFLDSMTVAGIARYEPSTNFYNIGICFLPVKGVSIEFSAKNKLINEQGVDASRYEQLGQRFFPTEHPFFEARAIWNIGEGQ
jgi:hypothetical protein